MARGQKEIKKRQIKADPVYGNVLLARFTNNLMKDGKKTTAQRVVYEALEVIKKEGENPIEVFEKAINAVAPRQEVRAKRVGGAAYQIPMDVRGPRKISLAIRWILDAARKRSNKEYKTFSAKLAQELMDSAKEEGEAIKRRDMAHKMAESNKAFSHFRF